MIARSPLAPTASIGRRMTASTAARSSAGDTSLDGVLDGVIRRSPASGSSPARSAGTTVAAAALAEQIMRGGTPSSSPTPTIRRFDNMPPLPPIPPPSNATSRPPTAPPVDTSPGSKAFWEQVDSTDEGAAWFRNQLQANFDRIVELLEDRIIGELERRGGRFRGGSDVELPSSRRRTSRSRPAPRIECMFNPARFSFSQATAGSPTRSPARRRRRCASPAARAARSASASCSTPRRDRHRRDRLHQQAAQADGGRHDARRLRRRARATAGRRG